MADRLTQEAVEAIRSALAAHARTTQVAVEVLRSALAAHARTTQVAVEVLVPAHWPGVWAPPILIPYAKPTIRAT